MSSRTKKRMAEHAIGDTASESKKSKIPSQTADGFISVVVKDTAIETTSQQENRQFGAVIESVSLIISPPEKASQTGNGKPNFKAFVRKRKCFASQTNVKNQPTLEDFPMPEIDKKDIQVSLPSCKV